MPVHRNANIDKFLTPESMLTPGIAGSMAMMIGNTLHFQFNLPNGWSVLILSFVFGLLVLAHNTPMLTKSVLYVLNSLVIFCVAAGTITLSSGNGRQQQAASFTLIQPAYAQKTTAALQAEYDKLSAEYTAAFNQVKMAPKGTDVTPLLRKVEEIDSRRSAVLRSIEAQSKGKTPTAGGERKFFAPLKF